MIIWKVCWPLNVITRCGLFANMAQYLFLLIPLFSAVISSLLALDQVFSNQFAVHVPGGHEKARNLAKRHSCEFLGQIGTLEDYYLLESPRIAKRSLTDASAAVQNLKDDPDVLWSEQQDHKIRNKRDFGDSSGDEGSFEWNYAARKANLLFKDPLYIEQWYLHKGARGGFDMNVEKAWRRNYTGRGVAVSILDDGVQPNHPDLQQNYYPLASLDINGKDNDPTPTDDGNNKHGTRCAGEVAAVAGNDICGVGIAYNAHIGGVRMLDGDVHDSVEATALSLNPQDVHIYSASWGPNDDGQTVDGPGKLAKLAFENGISQGRGGLGSIFVWASGNGGKSHDSCSCDGYTNSIWTISISSAAEDGSEPWYLEECPSTLATTYSSGNNMQRSIVTTDLNMPNNGMQACTLKHTGTSAAAPLAAGIIALALEANPKLTWRDLQYLTMLSARPEPLIDDNWATNAMGRKVSNKFGYGLMDADKMVQLAEKWITVPEQHVCHSQQFVQQLPVMRGRLAVEVTTDGCQPNQNAVFFLEHVQVVLSINAQHRGTLSIRVTSPRGTSSILLPPRPLDNSRDGFHDWPFMSVQFWGENPAGTWKIEILDGSPSGSQPNSFLVSWSVVVYGTRDDPLDKQLLSPSKPPDDKLAPVTPSCHLSCKTCHGPSLDECDTCFARYYFHNSHCLLTCPPGFFSNNKTFSCNPCPNKCMLCSSPTTCTVCQTDHVFNNRKCVPASAAVTSDGCSSPHEYFDHRQTKCLPCHEDCASCSGSADLNCVKCKPPKVLYGKCLDSCPTNFSDVDGICQVTGSGGFFEFIKWKPSHKYYLTATAACTVIVLIGVGVFCMLQRSGRRRSRTDNRTLDGVKYARVAAEKAPLKPMDDSDEEVETFSKNHYASVVSI